MTKGGRQLRTLVVAVVLMVIAGFVPAFAMGLVGWADGVNVGILAGTAVLIACLGGTGWRTGLIVSLPFALFAGLANWAAPNPWLAAIVLAGAALVRGYAAKAGMHDALTMAVIALGFIVTSPVSVAGSLPVTSAAYVALLCLACGLWATLVIFLLRRRLHLHQHTGLDPIRVVTYSLTLAGLVGVATWFVIDLGLGHTGGWIILTILVVFQPSLGAGFKKAAARAAGTVLGIASLLFVAFLTPGIVLLDSAGSTVQLVAEQRLGATLIGVLGTVVVMLALAPLSTRLFSERTPTRQSLSERPSRQV